MLFIILIGAVVTLFLLKSVFSKNIAYIVFSLLLISILVWQQITMEHANNLFVITLILAFTIKVIADQRKG
ncbi:hypothetical protein D5F52_03375 [Brevibacillus laterosporus]|nr:hypothetical protein BrL25_01155 [Brevibacillus laterosporus DSM 25]AYB37401.1 hypothetical protein D5F52_03375 [Brevibacillus laterosporus]MBG9804968.1 hypothetical protein [Brevibacillus laterosporus]PPA87079.1 hypothetical protein C4A75_03630 [Brevibacillus laterosporus]TPH10044.1 hypothetical protein EGH09_20985 [Brevibacillus laterosporus]